MTFKYVSVEKKTEKEFVCKLRERALYEQISNVTVACSCVRLFFILVRQTCKRGVDRADKS